MEIGLRMTTDAYSDGDLDFGVVSVNYELDELLA